MLTVSFICDFLQVSEETVRRWLRSGELKGEKKGNAYLIKEEDLKSYLFKKGGPNSILVKQLDNPIVKNTIRYHNSTLMHEGNQKDGGNEPYMSKEEFEDLFFFNYFNGNNEPPMSKEDYQRQLYDVKSEMHFYKRKIFELNKQILDLESALIGLSEKELSLRKKMMEGGKYDDNE